MRVRRFLLTALVVTWTAAPGYAQWVATPYLGMNVLGDVEQRKGRPWRINQLFRRPGRVRIRFQRYQHSNLAFNVGGGVMYLD